MARITKLQKAIFDRHLESFKSGTWDVVDYAQAGDTTDQAIARLKEILLEGKTVKVFWDYLWDKHASMTSQLMASPNLLGVVSKTATTSTRTGMKHMLNSKLLNIK